MTTHSWCTHLSGVSSPELQYCSDKSTTIACLSTEGREGETEGKTAALIWQLIRKVSGYNLPELLNLDLPISHFLFFFFFSLIFLHPSTHPPSVSELQISPCVSSQARREIRSEVLDVSAIGACCSFSIVFILFSAFIYLSVTTWMYGFLPLYTRMRGDFCLWER